MAEKNGEVGCIAYNSTNPTNPTNRTNPTTKYRCKFVNLNCIFTNFTHSQNEFYRATPQPWL